MSEPKKPTEDQIATVIDILADRDWTTARELSAITPGFNDRLLRQIANASQGQIISGQKGYTLTRKASLDEVERAANWLRHQADEMTRRAGEISTTYTRAQNAQNQP